MGAPTTGDSSVLVSASRDKTLIKWDVSATARNFNHLIAGRPVKSLVGHSDFVQDVQVSSDGAFALSASWDNTLALWDLNTGTRRSVFRGHTNDVTSVAFSPCNRQIVSGSRDRTIMVWNTIADPKGAFDERCESPHKDWVSCVRFSPPGSGNNSIVVSGGQDGKVKVWSTGQDWGHQHTFDAHPGYVSSVCISPDGSLCASGGKDGVASLWDLTDKKKLYDLAAAGDAINCLVFSPNRYWLSVAAGRRIKIFDLENRKVAASLPPEKESDAGLPEVLCLAWSHDGSILYAGYTDNLIRAYQVEAEATSSV